MSRGDRKWSSTARFVPTSRGRFAYLSAAPSAPPSPSSPSSDDDGRPLVVVLHGFPDSPFSFLPLLNKLANAGAHAVAPFLRGYHPSPVDGPYDPDTLANDVLAFVDALCEGERTAQTFSVVGHDWGSMIAHVLLDQAPARLDAAVTMSVPHPAAFMEDAIRSSAQLSRSWYMGFFQVPGLAERVVPRDDFAFVDRLLASWSPGFRFAPETLAETKAAIAPGFPAAIGYYRALGWSPLQSASRVRASRERSIETPTLHITGATDGCIGPEIGAQELRYFRGPYARVVQPGVGHFPHLEATDDTAARIVDWLSEHGVIRTSGAPRSRSRVSRPPS